MEVLNLWVFTASAQQVVLIFGRPLSLTWCSLLGVQNDFADDESMVGVTVGTVVLWVVCTSPMQLLLWDRAGATGASMVHPRNSVYLFVLKKGVCNAQVPVAAEFQKSFTIFVDLSYSVVAKTCGPGIVVSADSCIEITGWGLLFLGAIQWARQVHYKICLWYRD